MDWFSTLTLALGSAWTSGINLYATVSVLGLLQKFSAIKLPGGLDVLDNWWIIGIAGGLYLVEFVADKVPYVDSVWDVVHTFIRVPAGAAVAYAATNQMDQSATDYRNSARRRTRAFFARHKSRASGDGKSFARTCFQLGFINRRRHHRICRNDSRRHRAGFDCDCIGNIFDLLRLVFPESRSRNFAFVSRHSRTFSR